MFIYLYICQTISVIRIADSDTISTRKEMSEFYPVDTYETVAESSRNIFHVHRKISDKIMQQIPQVALTFDMTSGIITLI